MNLQTIPTTHLLPAPPAVLLLAPPPITREQWLNRVADELRPIFAELGYPLPPIRISTGFTSSGRRGRAVAECWTDTLDREKRHQIFLDPRDDDPVNVVNSVAHECAHAAVGLKYGHKGPFAKVCLALGMLHPMTATPSGPEFVKLANRILRKVGAYPHARLQIGYGDKASMPPVPVGTVGPDRPSTIITSGGKPQKARMFKAECGGCGYTVRLTRKWLAVAVPACPNPACPDHGKPMVAEV